MGNPRHPRRGSMQFWPRKRSKHSFVRVRSWANVNDAKPLGFICFKAGMTHLMVEDNRPKSITKGETIRIPSTIIECPPMGVMGVSFYKNSPRGSKKSSSIMLDKLPKEVARKIKLPKKTMKKFDEVTDYDDLRLVVYSRPSATGTGSKKPQLMEVALGGKKEDKIAYAKEILGKEIKVSDVFNSGDYTDLHGVTKGKGFAGTVKRYGVPIRQHKAEKVKRGVANLGAWTPKRVSYTIPQPGKMGYHLRTEYNKQIVALGEDGNEVTRKGGIKKYGVVKNPYILIYGSVVGPAKKAILVTHAIRKTTKLRKEALPVKTIVTH